MHWSFLLSALKSIEFAFLGAILMRTNDGEAKHVKLYRRARRLYEPASGVYPGSVGTLGSLIRFHSWWGRLESPVDGQVASARQHDSFAVSAAFP